jgi:hypothetical protein
LLGADSAAHGQGDDAAARGTIDPQHRNSGDRAT